MSRFTDVVKQDTPRLVVGFQRVGEQEMFKWGIVGNLPPIPTIGYVTRVQAELIAGSGAEPYHDCPESALVLTWSRPANEDGYGEQLRPVWDWFIHKDVPIDPLVGYMEFIKHLMINAQMAQMAQMAQQGPRVMGPDGQPFRR